MEDPLEKMSDEPSTDPGLHELGDASKTTASSVSFHSTQLPPVFNADALHSTDKTAGIDISSRAGPARGHLNNWLPQAVFEYDHSPHVYKTGHEWVPLHPQSAAEHQQQRLMADFSTGYQRILTPRLHRALAPSISITTDFNNLGGGFPQPPAPGDYPSATPVTSASMLDAPGSFNLPDRFVDPHEMQTPTRSPDYSVESGESIYRKTSHSVTSSGQEPFYSNVRRSNSGASMVDYSPWEDYSARDQVFKRESAPPKNAEGKFVCKYAPECAGLIFDRKCEWSKHMDKHDRPYRCSHPACAKLQGFTYSGGLLRHEREVHNKHGGPKLMLMCPYEDCKRHKGRGFTFEKNLNEHIRRIHQSQNEQPQYVSLKSDAAALGATREHQETEHGDLRLSADLSTDRMAMQHTEATEEINFEPLEYEYSSICGSEDVHQGIQNLDVAASPSRAMFSTTDEGYYSMNKPELTSVDTADIDGDDDDDNRSIMTDGRSSDLPPLSKGHLEALFASELFEDLILNDSGISDDHVEDAFSSIPGLLKDFSELIGSRATSRIQERAVTFVRHSRQRIYCHIKEQLQSGAARRQLPKGEALTASAKFAMWNMDPGTYENDVVEAAESFDLAGNEHDFEDGPNFDIADIPSGLAAKQFLLESDEYKWLLEIVKRNLTSTPSDQISKIRQMFISNLPRRNHALSSENLELSLDLSWNPRSMINDCLGSDAGKFALNSVITITGGVSDAHAATCEKYMIAMWPNLGLALLNCIEQAALSESGTAEIRVSDTHIKLACQKNTTVLRAHGTSVNLLELFEAVAWLSTACRESPSAEFVICEPKVIRQDSPDLAFRIGWTFSKFESDEVNDGSATCWHNMFRNPVIAKGFPIPRRCHGEKGLELTLEMLAILGQTFWATSFNGILLKGFNSIASAVKRVGESVLWHFSVNKDGCRMPFGDARHHPSALTSGEVMFAGARHFVGWAEKVEIVAGTRHADYDNIEESDSHKASSGIGIDTTLALNGGYLINVGCKIRRRSKDAPEHLRWNLYARHMDTATRWGVVIVDTADRRHWLLDGATAILHLCRAWLSPKQVRYAPPGVAARIRQPEQSMGPDASYETLLDDANRELRLLASREITTKRVEGGGMDDSPPMTERTETWWCLENLAQQMFHTLEQIHDRVKRRDPSIIDIQLKKRTITGFEFRDLLREDGLIEPRSLDLQAGASDWLDFSINTNTVNIFGSNFGELIRPEPAVTSSARLCGAKGSVGVGYDYLAVPLSVLESVIGGHRKHSNTALHLAENIYIPRPELHFRVCECGRAPSSRCSALVTSFVKSPDRCASFESRHTIFRHFRDGAFIFGHQNGKLLKGNPRKRKAEAAEWGQPKSKRHTSDSGVDVGSSEGSSSPNSSGMIDGACSSSGYSFLGAAKKGFMG